MESENPTILPWLILRDLARPNAKRPAYKILQDRPDMEGCLFIPMKQKVFTEFGKPVVRCVPYLPDLLFVHKSREEFDPIVSSIPTLQYRYVRGGKQFEAMTVRHSAMSRFMEAVKELDKVEYYSLDEVSPTLYGKEIEIVGGRLDGFRGRLLSRRGSKVKRLIIDLEECNLSAAIQVDSEYIKLLS